MSAICTRAEEATITLEELDRRMASAHNMKLTARQRTRIERQYKTIINNRRRQPTVAAAAPAPRQPRPQKRRFTYIVGSSPPLSQQQQTHQQQQLYIHQLEQRAAILESLLEEAEAVVGDQKRQCLEAHAVIGRIYMQAFSRNARPGLAELALASIVGQGESSSSSSSSAVVAAPPPPPLLAPPIPPAPLPEPHQYQEEAPPSSPLSSPYSLDGSEPPSFDGSLDEDSAFATLFTGGATAAQ